MYLFVLYFCLLFINLSRVNTESAPDDTKIEDVATCLLPPETGDCKASMPRFYYDGGEDKCKQFIWGGCDGNDNKFETEEACMSACGEQKRDVDICMLPSDIGPCKANMPKFYYDHTEGTCKEFSWGGCDGNDNKFDTEETCMIACGSEDKKAADICLLPSEVGRCRAKMPRFYYDHTAGTCKEFIWGGCDGNDNKFETEEACTAACGEKQTKEGEDICSLPSETGPCKGRMPKFYYDKGQGVCKEFIYGGCQGNENRFETEQACVITCGKQNKLISVTTNTKGGVEDNGGHTLSPLGFVVVVIAAMVHYIIIHM